MHMLPLNTNKNNKNDLLVQASCKYLSAFILCAQEQILGINAFCFLHF